MMTSDSLVLMDRARAHGSRQAISDVRGAYSYDSLLAVSASVAASLLTDGPDLNEQTVLFLVPSSFAYVAVQWGIWRAGGIAVPLATSHPTAELALVLDDAKPVAVIAHPSFSEKLAPVAGDRKIRFFQTDEMFATPTASLPEIDSSRRAMIIYTSGTTGRPKGAVSTHANIEAQVTALVEAWGWTQNDRVLCVLPLHHVHGIINIVACALYSGANCDMMDRFDASETWDRFIDSGYTVFMAVPTIYRRLIKAFDEASPKRQSKMHRAVNGMRLMVSGSAALPVNVLERWREISGHTLLERYGMTELGMVLSNPLAGERIAGHVGQPLPQVEVRLTDDQGRDVAPGEQGEICVRGPNVFLEYWNRPEETKNAFRDGWFRTGDIALIDDSSYRIVGRASVDIIKTGGYKVSALEIEETLREHEAIEECAVVGVPDAEFGERVCVAVERYADVQVTLDQLLQWARERLAPYKLPRSLLVVESLPRNAMGKVIKPQVAKLFQDTT